MKQQAQSSEKAFSLVELLVVMVIIAIFLGFAAISLFKGSDSLLLTTTGDSVLGLFKEAQQTAIADSSHIEFRVYQLKNDSDLEATFYIQFAREKNDGGFQAVGSGFLLPQEITVNQSSKLSSLIDKLPAETDDDNLYPTSFTDHQYAAFRFNSDGSTNLNQIADNDDTWHLTLLTGNEGDAATRSDTPKDFYTISIDPFTGTTKIFRP